MARSRSDLPHIVVFNPDQWRGEPGSDSYCSFCAGQLDKGDDTLFCDSDWSNVLGAVDLIRSFDGERPLFIYLPLIFPHPPYAVEEPWFSMIDRGKLPARFAAPEGGKPSILEGIRRNQGLQGWAEERWTELRAVYYGMCARLDHQLGMIVEEPKSRRDL